jgi:hypothetical protein
MVDSSCPRRSALASSSLRRPAVGHLLDTRDLQLDRRDRDCGCGCGVHDEIATLKRRVPATYGARRGIEIEGPYDGDPDVRGIRVLAPPSSRTARGQSPTCIGTRASGKPASAPHRRGDTIPTSACPDGTAACGRGSTSAVYPPERRRRRNADQQQQGEPGEISAARTAGESSPESRRSPVTPLGRVPPPSRLSASFVGDGVGRSARAPRPAGLS